MGELQAYRVDRLRHVTPSLFLLFLSLMALPSLSCSGFKGQAKEIVIDLTDLQPRAAVAREFKQGAWWLREGVKGARGGTLLVAGPWSEKLTITHPSAPGELFNRGHWPGSEETYVPNLVPPVRFVPGVKGWHRIHFGIYSRAAREGRITNTSGIPQVSENQGEHFAFRFGARLKNDPYPAYIQGRDDLPNGFQEVYWKSADLTDQFLEISQAKAEMRRPNMGRPAAIDYVRLEPLAGNEGEGARKAAANPPPVAQRLFGMLDQTTEVYVSNTFENEEDIRAIVYRHKDAGFGRIYWRSYGTFSDHSMRFPEATAKWSEADEREHREHFQVPVGWMPYLKALEKFDPLKVAVEYGKQHGVEVHGWVRMCNYNRPPRARFWHEHPEYYLVEQDGTRLSRVLSFAHPQVRQYHVNLMKDIAASGVGGILLDWLRHPPAVGYEEDVCRSFRAKHGIDMRTLPDTDPRVSQHHSQYVNAFMRDLRKALPGLEISVRIRNMNEYGLDAATWVEEGLVDTIIEGNWGAGSGNAARDVEKGVLAINRGTAVNAYAVAESQASSYIWGGGFLDWFSAEDIKRYARMYGEKGVNRFGLYEATVFTYYPHRRHAIWEAATLGRNSSNK